MQSVVASSSDPRSGRLQITMLVMIAAMTMVVGASAKDITCTSVATKTQTGVVCHFGVDIQEKGLSFNVQFYPPSSETPETVLMCNHVKDSKQPECTGNAGVTFHGVTGTEARLTQPPPADEEREGGQFLCQLIPAPAGVQPRFCNLTYTDNGPGSESTTRDPGDSRLFDIDYEHAGFTMQIIICITLIIIVLFIVVGIIMCVYAYRNPIRLIRWWTKQSEAAKFRDPIKSTALEMQPTEETTVNKDEVAQEKVASTGAGGSRIQGLLSSCFRQTEANSDHDKTIEGTKGETEGKPGEGDKLLDAKDAQATQGKTEG